MLISVQREKATHKAQSSASAMPPKNNGGNRTLRMSNGLHEKTTVNDALWQKPV